MTPREKELHGDSTPPQSGSPVHPLMVGLPAGFGGEADEPTGRLLPGILHALRRRWLLILFLGSLLGAGAAYGVYKTAKNKYTATAWILIKPELEESGSISTERSYITGVGVLNTALNDPKVAGIQESSVETDPLDWYRDLISIQVSEESESMSISLTYEDSGEAADLLNAVLDAYLPSSRARHEDELEAELAELQSIQPEILLELGEATDRRDSARALAQPIWTADDRRNRQLLEKAIDEHFDVHIQLELLNRELAPAAVSTDAPLGETVDEPGAAEPIAATGSEPSVETTGEPESDAASVPLDAGADGDGDGMSDGSLEPDSIVAISISDEELDEFVEADPESQRLRREIDRATARIEDAKSRFIDGHTRSEEYIARQLAVAESARIKLTERREQLRTQLNRQLRRMQEGNPELTDPAERSRKIAALTVTESVLRAEINRLMSALPDEGTGAADVELEQLEVDILLDRHQTISAEISRLQDLKTTLPWISLPEEVYVPDRADQKPRIMKAGAAGTAVFMLMGAATVLFDLRRRRVSSPDDFGNDIQLNVIGTLPLLKRSRRKNQRLSRHLAEAVDSIAAALICGRSSLGTQAVMITSAVAGEGKTTLAANLATSLASAGRRTLLLDFDLRRPMLHSVYDVERGPGVCEALTGEIEAFKACHETDDPSLWIMPAGHWRERAISQLADERLQQLFTELRRRFDFIVVDASPVLPIVDARLVGKHVDGTILSLLRDVSEVPKVAAACRALEAFDVRILGGVMIGSTGEVYYGYPPSQGQLPESA